MVKGKAAKATGLLCTFKSLSFHKAIGRHFRLPLCGLASSDPERLSHLSKVNRP